MAKVRHLMYSLSLLLLLTGTAFVKICAQEGAGVAMHEYGKRIGQTMTADHALGFAVAAEQCEDVATLPTGNTWTLLDLGTANGLGSLPLVRECVERVRRASGSERPIAVVFEDAPWNDFSALLALDPREAFGQGVHPYVSSVGFFRPTTAPGSVHMAFSSAAMHYLSGPPPMSIVEGGLHHTDASAHEMAAFTRQAAEDWQTILIARATELAPGGRLVILNFGVDESGFYLGNTDYGASIYTELSACLREMVADGALTRKEFESATSPEYYRTLAEHVAPFDDTDGPVRRAGLSLMSAKMQHTRCVLRQRFAQGEFESADEYGEVFAKAVSAFTRGKVMRAFADGTRGKDEREALGDETFRRFARTVAARPLAFGIDNVMALLVIGKKAAPPPPANSSIKSMRLYHGVERIYNNPGVGREGALTVEQLAPFDQLHYHGTSAVDEGIAAAKITSASRVMEAGAGYGGPARHIANATGAHVTAVELQPDLNAVAAALTERCELSGRVAHVNANLLEMEMAPASFDAVVSWLAWCHIADKERLLAQLAPMLKPGGMLVAEDLYARSAFSAHEEKVAATQVYAPNLPTREQYVALLYAAGFDEVTFEEMTGDWRELTGKRSMAYLAELDSHAALHGEPTVTSLSLFYSSVAQLFAAGTLGGARIVARKAPIKSMGLYSGVERIYNNPSVGRGGALTVEVLAPFDQLHYHGTDAVDLAVTAARIGASSKVMEAGSGYGGPARHIANATGAHVTAVELQPDMNEVARDLTARCGLADRVQHVNGDLLQIALEASSFDAVVSWLAWYHIADKATLLRQVWRALKPGGRIYVEDLFKLSDFDEHEEEMLTKDLFGIDLPTAEEYKKALLDAGFEEVELEDVTENWTALTVARSAKYSAERDTHVAVHGEAAVAGLTRFYSSVASLFASGKLGGARITATKLRSSGARDEL